MTKNKRKIIICVVLAILVWVGCMALTLGAVKRGMPTTISPADFSRCWIAPVTMLVGCVSFAVICAVLRTAVRREKKLIRLILAYTIACFGLVILAVIGMWIYGACAA